jgi:hypothetical protein
MLSYTERNARRGGTTEIEFLARLVKLGFRAVDPPRHGFLWEFEHPDTGPRRYWMQAQEGYSRALQRLEADLRRNQTGSMFREARAIR